MNTENNEFSISKQWVYLILNDWPYSLSEGNRYFEEFCWNPAANTFINKTYGQYGIFPCLFFPPFSLDQFLHDIKFFFDWNARTQHDIQIRNFVYD